MLNFQDESDGATENMERELLTTCHLCDLKYSFETVSPYPSTNETKGPSIFVHFRTNEVILINTRTNSNKNDSSLIALRALTV